MSNPTRSSLGAVFPFVALAVVGLLVGGVFAKEAIKHGAYLERVDQEAAAASAELKAFPFDAKGNVPREQRGEYEALMRKVQRVKDTSAMRGIVQQERLVSAGGFLAAVVLLAVAFRPRKAAASA